MCVCLCGGFPPSQRGRKAKKEAFSIVHIVNRGRYVKLLAGLARLGQARLG